MKGVYSRDQRSGSQSPARRKVDVRPSRDKQFDEGRVPPNAGASQDCVLAADGLVGVDLVETGRQDREVAT